MEYDVFKILNNFEMSSSKFGSTIFVGSRSEYGSYGQDRISHTVMFTDCLDLSRRLLPHALSPTPFSYLAPPNTSLDATPPELNRESHLKAVPPHVVTPFPRGFKAFYKAACTAM
jgi:hypothetical protein